jgi:hypothetical protein
MNILPHDLRARHHATLIKRRSWGVKGGTTPAGYDGSLEVAPPAPLGWLGRLWAKGGGLTQPQAELAMPNSSMATQGSLWGVGSLGSLLSGLVLLVAAEKNGLPPALAWTTWAAVTTGSFGLGSGLGLAAFRTLSNKPLGLSELEVLVEKAESELDRTFLSLVRDAIRTNLPDPPASEIRKSISALGEALDSLPEVGPSAVDPDALRAEAEQIDAQAMAETDRVTSDSLTRRADALRRRAESAERTALAGKRTAALRAEIQAQMEALREGLAALSVDAAKSSLADLSDLAENVRRVAAEAVGSIDAEAEIERISPRPGNQGTTEATEPQKVTLGR